MLNSIPDPDVKAPANIAALLQPDYEVTDESWAGSPFAWIRARPSRQRGKIGEQLVAGWFAAKGLDVVGSKSSQYDRLIHSYRIEVKFSTLWGSGQYAFQQIRNQDYQYAICLGVSPFSAHCWVVSKELLLKHVIGQRGQHTGRGGADTAWLHVKPGEPEDWLRPTGGQLGAAFLLLSRLAHG